MSSIRLLAAVAAAAVGTFAVRSSGEEAQQVLSSVESRTLRGRTHEATAVSEEWSYSSTNEGMAAFMLSVCNDPASAEYFMRVLSPPSADVAPLITPAILPAGFERVHVEASASRLLMFTWCSELDAPQKAQGQPQVQQPDKSALDEDEDPEPLLQALDKQSPQLAQYARARSAIAQKLIQRDIFRQMAAASGTVDPVNAETEARSLDLIGHTLLPLVRMAFHSSPKVMQDAKAYKLAWKQTADLLKQNGLIESELPAALQEAVNKLQSKKQEKKPVVASGGNKVGTPEFGSGGNIPQKFAEASLFDGSSFSSSEHVEASDAETLAANAEHIAARAQESLSLLASFLELDRDQDYGFTSTAADADADAEVEADAEEDAALQQFLGSGVDKLEPVSAAVGEKALLTVMNAFFTLLENPEFNFLRDVFAFDADSFCEGKYSAQARQMMRLQPGEKVPVTLKCNANQRANVARLFGLHAFRLVHLAAVGAVSSSQERLAIGMEHQKVEDELLKPQRSRRRSSGAGFGFERSNGEVNLDEERLEVHYGEGEEDDIGADMDLMVDLDREGMNHRPSKKKQTLFDLENDDDVGLLNKKSKQQPQRNQRGMALLGQEDLAEFTYSALGVNKKDLALIQEEDPKKPGAQQNADLSLPVELSVLDNVAKESWQVDSRVFFALQAVLSRVDDICQLGDMASKLPQTPSFAGKFGGMQVSKMQMQQAQAKADQEAVNKALGTASQPVPLNGALPTPPKPGSTSGQKIGDVLGAQGSKALGEEHIASNPFVKMLASLGFVQGEHIPSDVPATNAQGSGFQLTQGYRHSIYQVNKQLQNLLFDSGYEPKMPAETATAAQVVSAPLGYDLFLAEVEGMVSRRRAAFYTPTKANWQALLEGKALQSQSQPDAAYFARLQADVGLLARVVVLANLGAERQRTDRTADAGVSPKPEALRPPRLLLAAAQMAYGGDGYDKVYLTSAPQVNKYAEHAALAKWNKRALEVKATGVSYGSKKTRLLSYSTIDAILMPPPLNPATRDKKLPSDPALAAAEKETRAGYLCGAILGSTSKHHRKALNGITVFGPGLSSGTPEVSNNAQVVPEPNESRRYYVMCTQKRASERGFDVQAKQLATAFCAAAHNVGAGMQLQLEEWYKGQQYLVKANADNAVSWAATVRSYQTELRDAKAHNAKPANQNILADIPEPPVNQYQPQVPEMTADNLARVPAFWDKKAQQPGLPGPLKPAFEPFALDCASLIKDANAAVATAQQEEQEQLIEDGDPDRNVRPSVPVRNPAPLELAIIDPSVARGRKAWVDRRFTTFASRFANSVHRMEFNAWIQRNYMSNDSPSLAIQRLKAANMHLSLKEKIYWSSHFQMTASRKVPLALGPEYPLLLFCAAAATQAPDERQASVVSDDGKIKFDLSKDHTSVFAATYVSNDHRVAIVSFPGFNGAGNEWGAGALLAMGYVKGGHRYAVASKTLKAVMADFKGYTIVLTGFSYGGLMSAHLSKQYGIRAYAFAPAALPKHGFLGRGLLALVLRTATYFPLIGTRLAFRSDKLIPERRLGNSWLHMGVPRDITRQGTGAEVRGIYAKTKTVRGNGLITIVAAAGDWAAAAYFREKDIARHDRGYELIPIPAMTARTYLGSHNIGQYAALPIACDACLSANKGKALVSSGSSAVPTVQFERFATEGDLDSYNIEGRHVLSWLQTYEKILEAMPKHVVGFEKEGGVQLSEKQHYSHEVIDTSQKVFRDWNWLI